ncbi:hypothetical protein L2K70_04710 [Nocardioides KLBMP 9356]|uniref:Phage tail tape measure protein n=1 Tax=Nocardioides potassii TaxID=2911371 RepID=A0ABS9H9X5_9ACTN|nr:hypothetical protein [Nocardioides potassii]MCF6376896.1 hypothetical protein [Nocardioides potassii]
MSTAIVFDILARDRASDKFDHVGDSASRSSGKLKKFAAVGAGAVAGGAIIAGKALFDMGKAAMEDEESQKKLATALKNSAGATDQQVASTEKWIERQGKSLGVADDELRPALSRLATATGDVGKAQELTSLAMDVSAGTGKSLKTVTEALMKAQNGSLGGLSRLGVATKDQEGKEKSLKQVTKELADLHQGQASNAANTAQGKFRRLSVQFDEVKETIGQKLLPMAEKLADWLLRDGIPAAEKFAKVAGPVIKKSFQLIGDAFEDTATAGKWLWEKVLRPTFSNILQGFETLAGAAADMLDAMSKAPGMGWAAKAADKLRNMAEKAGEADRAIRGIPSYKSVSINISFLYPKGKPTKHIEDTNDWIINLGNGRGRAGTTSMTAQQAGERLMDAVADGIRRGGKKLDKVLEAARDRIKDKFSSIRDEMSSLSQSIASGLTGDSFGFSDIAQEVDSTTGEVTTAAQSAMSQSSAQLASTNTALKNLMATFAALKGSASKGFLSSLMQSGNLGLIQQYANDPSAVVRDSALFDENAAIAKGLGDESAQAILGDRFATELEKQIKKLVDELKDQPGKTARKLRDEIKDLRLIVEGLNPGQKAHLQGAW